ncbi:MAG: hypothetical protein J3K34DRAFT_434182 [Monoraphidium minutum]|nr:MAG: hypothetical protein J3K34DRAFT_434182 [Monoraphidium minutum]
MFHSFLLLSFPLSLFFSNLVYLSTFSNSLPFLIIFISFFLFSSFLSFFFSFFLLGFKVTFAELREEGC